MGLPKIGLIIVFKIQILKQLNIATTEKVCFDKKWEHFPKKVHKYTCQYQKLIRKLKYAKSQKHKNVYSDTWHTYIHNKQPHKPRFVNNVLMTYKQ